VGALFCLVCFVVAEGVWAESPMWGSDTIKECENTAALYY